MPSSTPEVAHSAPFNVQKYYISFKKTNKIIKKEHFDAIFLTKMANKNSFNDN